MAWLGLFIFLFSQLGKARKYSYHYRFHFDTSHQILQRTKTIGQFCRNRTRAACVASEHALYCSIASRGNIMRYNHYSRFSIFYQIYALAPFLKLCSFCFVCLSSSCTLLATLSGLIKRRQLLYDSSESYFCRNGCKSSCLWRDILPLI